MLTKIKKIVKNNPWFWYNIRNSGNHLIPVILEENINQIVENLNNFGIAKSTFEIVFKDLDFEEFSNDVHNTLNIYENNKTNFDYLDKEYMNFILGLNPIYEPNSLWVKISEHNSLKLIAQSYFKMKDVEMRYYNIWKHESSDHDAKGSQLWHRDREDVKILKVFICIEDVDFNKGPFVYAPGTHTGGNVTLEPDYFLENTGIRRTTDEMMEKIVPSSKWIYSTGRRGTIVFADTHGYHKGGYVNEGYRLLFTCMYVSPACERFYFKSN